MYMYYFLGFLLEARDDLSEAQKHARAMNTYLLALGQIKSKYSKTYQPLFLFVLSIFIFHH